MKKFNPEKEMAKLRNSNQKLKNGSHLSNLFVPVLVMACSCMAMSAVAFSAYLEEEELDSYDVHIDIINGNDEVFEARVHEGSFKTTITSANTFGSIECTSGKLSYDPLTQTISSPYLNRNTSCIITFMNDGVKNLDPAGLNSINDNNGISHYYKADSENNYVLLNDMMFRIVRINGDGTLRLILDDVIMVSPFGETNNYMNSSIKLLLENWYNETFHGEEYLCLGDYDITNYDTVDTETLVNLEGYYNSYVGLLSIREAEVISSDVEENYLNHYSGVYLMNANGQDNVFAINNNQIDSISHTDALGIKPVININTKLIGNGTKNNPYTISE